MRNRDVEECAHLRDMRGVRRELDRRRSTDVFPGREDRPPPSGRDVDEINPPGQIRKILIRTEEQIVDDAADVSGCPCLLVALVLILLHNLIKIYHRETISPNLRQF